MWLTIILNVGLVLLGSSALGVLIVMMQRALARLNDAQAMLAAKVADLGSHMILTGQATPIHVALQAILVQELTHMHTPACDALLAKLGPPFTLTDAEEVELLRLMRERATDLGDEISESERDAARMLPLLIRRVRREKDATGTSALIVYQVVSASLATPEKGEQR